MGNEIARGDLYLVDTNQDGIFDIHSDDQVFDQDGRALTVSQVLSTHPNLGEKFKYNGERLLPVFKQDVQQAFMGPIPRLPSTVLPTWTGPLGVVAVIAGGYFFTQHSEDLSLGRSEFVIYASDEDQADVVEEDEPETDSDAQREMNGEISYGEYEEREGNRSEAAIHFGNAARHARDAGLPGKASKLWQRAADLTPNRVDKARYQRLADEYRPSES